MQRSRPSKDRGRRECRAPAAPAALCAKGKSTQASHHRFSTVSRHSPRNGFNGFLRALPGVHDVLSHRHPLITACRAHQGRHREPADLAPAKGRQDHTTSPSAVSVIRLMTYRVHRIPHSRFVTIAIRPSCRRRDARDHAADLGFCATSLACGRLARRAIRRWHACTNCPSGKRHPFTALVPRTRRTHPEA